MSLSIFIVVFEVGIVVVLKRSRIDDDDDGGDDEGSGSDVSNGSVLFTTAVAEAAA